MKLVIRVRIRIYASLWDVDQILYNNTTPFKLINFFFLCAWARTCSHNKDLRAGFSLLEWAAASPMKSERPRLLMYGFNQLPRLASLLKWVDFSMNRVLILPKRVHAFSQLRKSMTIIHDNLAISRSCNDRSLGGLLFLVLVSSEVFPFATIIQINSPYRGLRLNCFQRGACRCSSESTIFLSSFKFVSQTFKLQAMKTME